GVDRQFPDTTAGIYTGSGIYSFNHKLIGDYRMRCWICRESEMPAISAYAQLAEAAAQIDISIYCETIDGKSAGSKAVDVTGGATMSDTGSGASGSEHISGDLKPIHAAKMQATALCSV